MADAKKHGTITRGERVGTSKLTAEKIAKIKQSQLPTVFLAAQFGVHRSTIRKIILCKLWAHVAESGSPINKETS